ncbi:MAG TPA: GNAT family N-acetyltransferase [Longimicrobium sp.]|jgi:GNAT superfamily N-acetyltransferase|uniref:GNAT family N-acetyltransferase n=1 Tax=Longimicrobium sp. TaxID=2029185 RepID=UPI002ED86948
MHDAARSLTFVTDRDRMDVDAIHTFLSEESYWAQGIPRDVVQRAMAGSLCFGVLDGSRQVAFARVVTDGATFAYLCDVFVIQEYRGRGVAHQLMQVIDRHPALQGLRRWNLVTRDAHDLYARFGFTAPARPEGYMERLRPDIYTAPLPAVDPGGSRDSER